MKSFRRPSPALVISLIALFVSLSGVSYGVATGFIDSRELKNNQVRSVDLRNNDVRTRDLRNNEVRGIDIRNSTVQGRDVALNTLTGDDVNESRLGKVPSAAAADTATTAGSAQNVRTIASDQPGAGRHAGHSGDARAADGRPALLRRHGRHQRVDHGDQLRRQLVGPEVARAVPISTRRIRPRPSIPVTDPAGLGPSGFAAGLVASAANGQTLSGQLSVLADLDAATCSAQGHLVLAG